MFYCKICFIYDTQIEKKYLLQQQKQSRSYKVPVGGHTLDGRGRVDLLKIPLYKIAKLPQFEKIMSDCEELVAVVLIQYLQSQVIKYNVLFKVIYLSQSSCKPNSQNSRIHIWNGKINIQTIISKKKKKKKKLVNMLFFIYRH